MTKIDAEAKAHILSSKETIRVLAHIYGVSFQRIQQIRAAGDGPRPPRKMHRRLTAEQKILVAHDVGTVREIAARWDVSTTTVLEARKRYRTQPDPGYAPPDRGAA